MPFARSLFCILLLAGSVDTAALAGAQRLRQWAREQNVRNPGERVEFPAPPWDYTPTTIEALTADSALVVVARLSRIKSYPSRDEDFILTDYALLEPRILAGRAPIAAARAPGAAPPLTLTVWGGEVVVEGVPIRGTDNNREAIVDGGEYLLFLRAPRSVDSGYEIYNGAIFFVSEGRAKPLLKNAADIFGMTHAPLPDLMARVQRAAKRR